MGLSVNEYVERFHELEGFDIDLVGFDCAGWAPPTCPFKPGCGRDGVAPNAMCPLMQRLAQIARAPRRWQ